MYLFQCDYNQMCHPAVLKKLNDSGSRPMVGYGTDEACRAAADRIRALCNDPSLSVHFLSGGTQTNLTVIAAALRPHQAVIAPHSGHISEHETGAIEAVGHKVLCLPSEDGKITATQIDALLKQHYTPEGPGPEHTPQPKMVYLSMSTELGTVYTLSELEAIAAVCRAYNLYLYMDGARLGYALASRGCDVTMPDLARLCDAFYIGGTKQGAMFGEAVVISNPAIAEDFRYLIKQRGGMLAKGWLMGLQFEALLEDDVYWKAAAYANALADEIRQTLAACHYPMPVNSPTNQVFCVMPDEVLAELAKDFLFTEWTRVDKGHRMIRFCTSWSTQEAHVLALCQRIAALTPRK